MKKPKTIDDGMDKCADIVTCVGVLSADVCFYGIGPDQLRFVAKWCEDAANYIEHQKKKPKKSKNK